MARIAGVDIPREKRVEVALTYIFGVGPHTARRVLTIANVDPNMRVKNLNDEQVGRLRDVLDKEAKVEGELRREIALNIKRLMEIGTYRSAASAPVPTPAPAAVRARRLASGRRRPRRSKWQKRKSSAPAGARRSTSSWGRRTSSPPSTTPSCR